MEPLVASMIIGETKKRRSNLRFTVLFREGGTWSREEVGLLTNGLRTEIYGLPRLPEYLVVLGHFDKDATLRAIGGGKAYTATQVMGLDDPRLPFKPQGF